MKTQPATGETYPKSDLFNKAYTLYKNAQSNVVKSFRDIDQGIIANFK
ncbi:EscF/YscF/HrpA family type III secretion system needle major subunit [Citrobacter freundii]|nr:EscF/YscF/HrpA family type III secretion system needle major subunit [Citrobacter freundii]MDK7604243.1 EscF/YscF/HrpA family type III secretion system needle major subunit [Citrobacter freundii]